MPYKPYSGTPGQAGNQTAQNNGAMAKELQQTDVVMQDAWATPGVTEAPAADTAEGQLDATKKFFPKKFGGVSKPIKPVSNAVKKRRMNFRLRKFLSPKSPLMVLNELIGSVSYSFVDNPTMALNAAGMHHMFTAQCSVEGETFTGSGPSKQIAKNICAEHVIQYIVTKKCSEARVKKEDPENPKMEDETPWIQLASLALFKMFNDWQAQGFVIPSELLKTTPETPSAGVPVANQDMAMPSAPKKPKEAKKLPDNPTERHPVQLLNELKGAVAYNVTAESGTSPNVIFTMTCEIEGIGYNGVGKSKKDAKKHCAMEALKALYNVQYPGTLSDA